ncbi:hypothetical protein OKA04_19795 [Luteolibacter flavescens]|uniref:Uncharacterized protein n=1 Tax=Luteolibacter flavescens TaxID=1859460 RepID=A0ABT3FTU4_9BACT|nr:hypothetical protein [Luteolibacter flavescens]MCW1886992.1 hypothetical protein [Luteolibacter flavescens]
MAYSIGLAIAGLIMVDCGVRIIDFNPVAAWAILFSGVANIALGVIARGRTYFEVFEDRIELLSPVFTKMRRTKPIKSIRSGSLHHRLVARRDDFARFIAWQRDHPH